MTRSLPRLVVVVAVVAKMAASVPARAAAPAGRYTTTPTTVFDTKTNLTWQRMSPSTTFTWNGAKTYCASEALATALGGTGWRLPTLKELETILDTTRRPTIDAMAFPGTTLTHFWSVTQAAGNLGEVWFLDFSFGYTAVDSALAPSSVRCVR